MAKSKQGVENAFENGKSIANLSIKPSEQTIEGVNLIPESFQETLGKLNSSFQDMIGKVLGKNSVFKEFSKDLTGVFGDVKNSFMNSFESVFSEEGPLGSAFALFSKPKAKSKLRPTTNDLLKLDGENSSGALLLYWKLDDIEQNYLKGKNKKGSSDEGGGKGIFSKIFGGVGKAAGGLLAISVALVAFAGAALLFSQIPDMGKALVGLGGFALFVWGAYSLAKGLEQLKAGETFKQFAITLVTLTGAFLLFSFTLIAAAYAADYVFPAIKTVATFIVFTALAVLAAKFLNESKADLVNFSLGVLALTGAFLLMSVTFIIASYIPEEGIKKGLIVLGGIVALTLVAAIAGKLAEKGQNGIQSLAVFVLTLTGALILTGVACMIMKFIEWEDLIKAGAVLGALVVLGVIAAAAGNVLTAGMSGLTAFGIFALLLAGALLLMTVPILVVKNSGITLETVGNVALIMLASVGLGLAAAALGFVFLNPLVLGGLTLAILGFTAMSLAVKALITPVKLLNTINTESIAKAEKNITGMKSFVGELSKLSIGPVTVLALMFLTASLNRVSPGITQLAQLTNQIGSIKAVNIEDKTKAIVDTVTALNTVGGQIKIENIKVWKEVSKITTPVHQLAEALTVLQNVPVGTDLSNVIVGLTDTLKTLGTVDVKGKIDKKAMETLSSVSKAFGRTIRVVQSMADFDNSLVSKAKDGILQISGVIKDFNQTMASTVRVSQKQTQSIVAIQDLIRTEVALVKFVKFLTNDEKSGITVPQIASASEIVKSIGWVVVSLNNNILSQLKKVDTAAASSIDDVIIIAEKITNGNFLSCLAAMKALDFSGLQIAAKGLNQARIDPKTLQNLKNAVSVIESFDASKIQTVGSALGTIAGVSNQLRQVANDIERIANNAGKMEKIAVSFERLAKASQTAKAGVFDVDFLSGGKSAGDGRTAANYRGKEKSNEEKELEKIYNLLSSWYGIATGGAEPGSLIGNGVYSEKVTAGIDPFINTSNQKASVTKETSSGGFLGGVKSFFGWG